MPCCLLLPAPAPSSEPKQETGGKSRPVARPSKQKQQTQVQPPRPSCPSCLGGPGLTFPPYNTNQHQQQPTDDDDGDNVDDDDDDDRITTATSSLSANGRFDKSAR